MKTVYPRIFYTPPRGGGVAGGLAPLAGSGGLIPPARGSGGKRAQNRGSRGNVHYKVANLNIEVMLWFFSFEGNPIL
jgi:hypothetical protein